MSCIRLKPYRLTGRVLLDVQQLIPLPELEDFQVQLREKNQRRRAERANRKDYTRFDLEVCGRRYSNLPKRRLIFHVVEALVRDEALSPDDVTAALPQRGRLWFSAPGELDADGVAEAMADVGVEARRYFCADDELFVVDGSTYAFSNQWRADTLERLHSLAAAFPQPAFSYEPSSQEESVAA